MKKILNPFEYLSSGKAFAWGLLGILFSLGLMLMAHGPVQCNVTWLVRTFSMNLLLWLPLSTLLYLAALVFSPSRIRAVDIYASNLFALLPVIVMVGVSNAITFGLGHLAIEPGSVAEVLVRAVFNLVVIVLSVSMVWSMVWGCFAYYVAANIKGVRGVAIFVVCYIFVSVAIQLLAEYL